MSLHPLENALLWIIAIDLCLTPWALGAMHEWTQFISLGLAMAGFAISLISRHYSAEHSPEGAFTLVMWPKLVRFPVFWLGLIFCAYILLQALNPAWIYVINGNSSWVVPIEHITWLPSSVTAPFVPMNAWHALMLYATPWLVMCAAWVGFTRRSGLQRLLTVVVVNGAVLSIIGILQRATGTPNILWFVQRGAGWTNFSTFIYKNHAGAYFNLVFMMGVGLLYWHFIRGERRLERGNPTPVFTFLAILLGVGVLLTLSKAATILLIGFMLAAFTSFVVRCLRTPAEGRRSPLIVGTLCAMFVLFIGLGSYFLNLNTSLSRVGKMLENGAADPSITGRVIARQAAMEMAGDKVVTGWGAGSFREIFPLYQQNHPEIIWATPDHKKKSLWSYAHNDYVQLLDEFGLIGAILLLIGLACGLRQLWINRVYLSPPLLFMVLALTVTMAHAFVDFISHNPAVLLLWCVSSILVVRWAELEKPMPTLPVSVRR